MVEGKQNNHALRADHFVNCLNFFRLAVFKWAAYVSVCVWKSNWFFRVFCCYSANNFFFGVSVYVVFRVNTPHKQVKIAHSIDTHIYQYLIWYSGQIHFTHMIHTPANTAVILDIYRRAINKPFRCFSLFLFRWSSCIESFVAKWICIIHCVQYMYIRKRHSRSTKS